MRIASETFALTSNSQTVTFSVPYNNVKKLKIARLLYKTASSGNYVMIVTISGWNSDHTLNVSGKSIPYCYLQNLPRTTLTEVDYEASNDRWDVVQASPVQLHTVHVGLYINGSFTNTDITELNPVYIEFTFEVDE